MEKRVWSLAQIQEVPKESLILLSGHPGAGNPKIEKDWKGNPIVLPKKNGKA